MLKSNFCFIFFAVAVFAVTTEEAIKTFNGQKFVFSSNEVWKVIPRLPLSAYFQVLTKSATSVTNADKTWQSKSNKQSQNKYGDGSVPVIGSVAESIASDLEMISIPGGTFTMGSPESEVDRYSNETQHEVTLSAFKISKYEVTFAQYDAFCEATGKTKPPDADWGRGMRPVIDVSWEDANAFAAWAGCRLPTEAEWEYACRAGSKTTYSTGTNLTTGQANYNGNYPYNNNRKGLYKEQTMPVGSYPSNAFGLYDMHGNVWEWCSDWIGAYELTAQQNPKGAPGESLRVYRGGCWNSFASECRSAYRSQESPNYSDYNIGFRVVSLK